MLGLLQAIKGCVKIVLKAGLGYWKLSVKVGLAQPSTEL